MAYIFLCVILEYKLSPLNWGINKKLFEGEKMVKTMQIMTLKGTARGTF